MRYSIMPASSSVSIGDVQLKVSLTGATDIVLRSNVGQVFAELTDSQLAALQKVPGIIIKKVNAIQMKPLSTVKAAAIKPMALDQFNLADIFTPLHSAYVPGIIGNGLTVAVIDSGMRATHKSLLDKITYAVDFTGSGNTDDEFGHGTGVAYIICGQDGNNVGVAPGAKVMNFKILDKTGVGTDENVAAAIDAVISKVNDAIAAGLPITDPMYPNTINLSVGDVDNGDPNNIMRVACRAAMAAGIEVIAAAGNGGPTAQTVVSPAVEPGVIAAGAIQNTGFAMMDISSRGPTKNGLTKPDLVAWGENIYQADHSSDTSYVVKSGTSFAAPTLTGIDGLLWEVSRRVYGESFRIKYSDWLTYPQVYCVKPSDAPIDKDNDFGFGVPAIGTMVKKLASGSSGAGIDINSMMNLMITMMMMGMMMKMMTGVSATAEAK